MDARALARKVVPRRLRNWVRSPRATLRWLGDGLLDTLGGAASLEVRPGWRLVCPRTARRAYRAHVADPEQAAELDAFIAACRPPMLLFDAGAHFGLFSFAALWFGGPLARAVAVDPSPAAARMARRVARRNGLADRLEVVQAAAGAVEGRVGMVDVGVQASGYYVPADDAHPAGEQSTVPAVTVDALARRFGGPTHLKIDVEGFEEHVLRGAVAVLRRAEPPVVFLELHHRMVRERGLDPVVTLDLLASWGFTIYDNRSRIWDREELLRRDLVRVIARR
jgi:FkbM family methyltransferase